MCAPTSLNHATSLLCRLLSRDQMPGASVSTKLLRMLMLQDSAGGADSIDLK